MIIMEKALYEIIKTKASGRVYALRAVQNSATPYIVFQRTSSERWRSINNPSGFAQAYVQIDVYDSTFYGAKQLAAELEELLDGYNGNVTITGNSPQDVVSMGITLQDDIDLIDQTDEPLLFRNSATYLVTYEVE